MRENGLKGTVACKVNTKDGSAVAPNDYNPLEDFELVFEEGESRKEVKIPIINDDHFEGDEAFTGYMESVIGKLPTYAEDLAFLMGTVAAVAREVAAKRRRLFASAPQRVLKR